MGFAVGLSADLIRLADVHVHRVFWVVGTVGQNEKSDCTEATAKRRQKNHPNPRLCFTSPMPPRSTLTPKARATSTSSYMRSAEQGGSKRRGAKNDNVDDERPQNPEENPVEPVVQQEMHEEIIRLKTILRNAKRILHPSGVTASTSVVDPKNASGPPQGLDNVVEEAPSRVGRHSIELFGDIMEVENPQGPVGDNPTKEVVMSAPTPWALENLGKELSEADPGKSSAEAQGRKGATAKEKLPEIIDVDGLDSVDEPDDGGLGEKVSNWAGFMLVAHTCHGSLACRSFRRNPTP